MERAGGISDEAVRRMEIVGGGGVVAGCETGREGRKRDGRGEKEVKRKVQIEEGQANDIATISPG